MKSKINALIVGYGNIGQHALEAIKTDEDFELKAIIDPVWSKKVANVDGIPMLESIQLAPGFDVALLCVPSRMVMEVGLEILKMGKRTADIFDIHGDELLLLYRTFEKVARENNTAALISAGWDPGLDSVVRAMLSVMIPRGITFTNFGPGMSMGHSVAVKAINGVKDAISLTYPKGCGMHRRMVYIIPNQGANQQQIKDTLLNDPYFSHDETHVAFVESLDNYLDMGHGVHIERKGRAGAQYNQRAFFDCNIHNPAVTSQVLVMAARAIMKQQPGCYTMGMVPPTDYLNMTVDEIVRDLT